MSGLPVRLFTDPGCPFAFSAEPWRWRLRWRFGDQLAWETRMVVITESRDDYAARGITTESMAAGWTRLSEMHGMPMSAQPKPRLWATAPACHAVVAARLHAPDRADALLRRLRVRHFSGELLDEPATIAAAAGDAGIDPAALERWSAGEDAEAALREDMAGARDPHPAALALPHKLAKWTGGLRYGTPSYELGVDGRALAVPGFQPWESYDVAFANAAPELDRRPAPESVEEVLAWAGTPLATREVAAVCELSDDEARARLAAVAVQEHVGRDGFWALTA